MGLLKIVPNADGTHRRTWYARFTRRGQKTNVNLGVPIEGTVPFTVDADGRKVFDPNGNGDDAFDRSRKAALAELAKLEKRAKDGTTLAEREKRIYHIQAGKPLKEIGLDELPALWRGIARDYIPTEHRMRLADGTFARFATFARAFAREHGGACETVNTITPEIAAAFFNHIKAEFAWETVKNQMSLLSGAFARFSTSGEPNPFKVIKRNRETATRRAKRVPFTEAQIERAFEVSRGDDFFHPLIVTAACTGMRIGDCCNLAWEDVDLKGGFIDVVTAKAGVKVTIPIFPPLRPVLESALAERTEGAVKVFPDAAHRYNHKTAKGVYSLQGHIFNGVKPYIGMAIDDGKPAAETVTESGEPPAAEDVVAAIGAAGFSPDKAQRLIVTYRLFADGKSYSRIAEATGKTKGVASADLGEIERITGARIRPGAPANKYTHGGKTTVELIQATRHERRNAEGKRVGKRQACDYGWHSFRTAFATIALNYAKLPIETVRKILGHSSVQMTEDYNRGTKAHEAERIRKQMRGTVLGRATPKTIGETLDADAPALPAATRTPTIEDIIAGLTEEQRKEFARKLLGL